VWRRLLRTSAVQRITRFDPQTPQQYDKRHSLFGQMDPKHQITYNQRRKQLLPKTNKGQTMNNNSIIATATAVMTRKKDREKVEKVLTAKTSSTACAAALAACGIKVSPRTVRRYRANTPK
jgi:hypothetical protein